jgi:hypothetical protein
MWNKTLQCGKPGVFDALHREILDRLGAAGEPDWNSATLDAASVRAEKNTGPAMRSLIRRGSSRAVPASE